MDIQELFRGMLSNAAWDAVKLVFRLLLGGGVLTAIVGVVQKLRSGSLDWWVLGTLFVVSCSGLFFLTEKDAPTIRPLFVDKAPVKEPPLSPPNGLTQVQQDQLSEAFLKLPRPCWVRVAAPPEHMVIRRDIMKAAKNSFIPGMRPGMKVVQECMITADEKENSPELYPDELSYPPAGIVVVNVDPSYKLGDGVDTFLVETFRDIFGWNARPGKKVPEIEASPGFRESLIYIQIGPKDLGQK